MSSSADDERRAFVRRENLHLGAFLAEADTNPVRWSRSYRCTCGFACYAPADMWDHSLTCNA